MDRALDFLLSSPYVSSPPLLRELHEVVAVARQVREVTRGDEAREIWAGVYPTLSEGEPGMVGAVISRAEAQVLRLSALYAVLDRSAVIRAAHLHAALAVWDYAEASARRIFGGLLGDPTADVILNAIRTNGPMAAGAIHDLFSRNKPARDIRATLEQLQTSGKVRCRVQPTSGRPARVWEIP